jgi:hypothetical protein
MIQGELGRSVDADAREPGHPASAQPSEQQPDRATGQRQERTLGNHLPQDPKASRTQRAPERHLPTPLARAHEHQVGHVRAGEQEEQRDRPEQDEQRRANLADQKVSERLDPRTHPRIGIREVALEPLHDHLELGVRLPERHPRRQPSDGADEVRTPEPRLLPRGPVPTDRIPELDLRVRKAEALGRDAHDLVRPRTELQRAADDLGICAEEAHPEVVAQDDDVVGSGPRLLETERATQRGRHAQRGEEVSHHLRARQDDGLSILDVRDLVDELRVAGDVHECLDLPPPVEEVGRSRGHVHPAEVGIGLVDRDEPLGLIERKRPEEVGVDRAENGGGRPDAEREHAYGHRGEAAVAAECPEGEADVLPHRSERRAAGASPSATPDDLSAEAQSEHQAERAGELPQSEDGEAHVAAALLGCALPGLERRHHVLPVTAPEARRGERENPAEPAAAHERSAASRSFVRATATRAASRSDSVSAASRPLRVIDQ